MNILNFIYEEDFLEDFQSSMIFFWCWINGFLGQKRGRDASFTTRDSTTTYVHKAELHSKSVGSLQWVS